MTATRSGTRAGAPRLRVVSYGDRADDHHAHGHGNGHDAYSDLDVDEQGDGGGGRQRAGPTWGRRGQPQPGRQASSARVGQQAAARQTRAARVRQQGAARQTRARVRQTRKPARRGRRPARRRPVRFGNPRRRLRVAAVGVAALLIVLTGRLVQLQAFQSSRYAKRAEQQLLRVVALPATRGEITDRNGGVLARDVDARDVYADPLLVTDPNGTAAELAPLLRRPVGPLRTALSGHGRFVYLARGVDPAIGAAVSGCALPGIGVLPVSRRSYPSHDLAANVVGFTGRDAGDRISGRGGVELAYDQLLRGRDGSMRVEEDPAGRPIPSSLHGEAVPKIGLDVQLTLDRDIQWAAQSALRGAVRSSKARGGTIIVMDPHSGDLLAMASTPTFDPNAVGRADPASLGNPATADVYEPGSVNKVITIASAIDAGFVTPDTPVTVPPTLPVGGSRIHDAEDHGVENLTVAGVLAKSSNIGTILVSRTLGTPRLEDALRRFGLGATTGVGFPGESRGLLTPSVTWSASQAATIPFGQGMSATALQMAEVYATVANGGVRVPPRLVRATVEQSGKVHPMPVGPGTRVVSQQTATSVSQILEAVTTREGTAPLAAIPGYRVAGKTGTANRVDPSCGCYRGYVASFVGLAPADNPKAVVEVVLDDPQDGHSGGQVSAPVFSQVMSFALQSLRVAPTGSAPAVPRLRAG